MGGIEVVGLSKRTWKFIQDFQCFTVYAGNQIFHKLLPISKNSFLKFTKLKIKWPFMFCSMHIPGLGKPSGVILFLGIQKEENEVNSSPCTICMSVPVHRETT